MTTQLADAYMKHQWFTSWLRSIAVFIFPYVPHPLSNLCVHIFVISDSFILSNNGHISKVYPHWINFSIILILLYVFSELFRSSYSVLHRSYLYQSWFNVKGVLYYFPQSNCARSAHQHNRYCDHTFENTATPFSCHGWTFRGRVVCCSIGMEDSYFGWNGLLRKGNIFLHWLSRKVIIWLSSSGRMSQYGSLQQ